MTTVCGVGDGNVPLPGDPDFTQMILQARATFGGIALNWTYPSINGHAISHTTVLRSATAVLADAVPLATIGGSYHLDISEVTVGATYYYWIRPVSINGTVGVEIGPASAAMLPAADFVVALLTNKVDSSLLNASLRANLDSIVDVSSSLTTETQTRLFNENIFDQLLAGYAADLSAVDTLVVNEVTERLTSDSALVAQVDLILAQANGNSAAILTEQGARADADSAAALLATTLEVAVGFDRIIAGDTTTLEINPDGMYAERTMKFDVNGRVSGLGFRATPEETDFIFLADTFAVGFPADALLPGETAPINDYPFIISRISGEPVIVLNAATYIESASINNAMIGQFIQSVNWDPTTKQGWLIDKEGEISANSITIYDNDGQVLLSSGGLGGNIPAHRLSNNYLFNNLIDVSGWVPGAAEPWALQGAVEDNQIIAGVGPRSATIPLWEMSSSGLTLAPNDTFYDSAVLSLHGDGADAATVFADSSPGGQAFTVNGAAQLDTAEKKFGTASMLFDGATSYLVSTQPASYWKFLSDGLEDFTVEFWLYPRTATTGLLLDTGGWLSTNIGFSVFRFSTDSITVRVTNASGGTTYAYTKGFSGIAALNTWTHYAVTYDGTNYRIFINGVLQSTEVQTTAESTGDPSSTLTIGRSATTSAEFFDGSIDDLRITRGVARYLTSFTLPTAAFLDVSPANAGTVASASKLSLDAHADFAFGGDSICIEGWIYPTNLSSNRVIFDFRSTVSDPGMVFISGADQKLYWWDGVQAVAMTLWTTEAVLAVDTWAYIQAYTRLTYNSGATQWERIYEFAVNGVGDRTATVVVADEVAEAATWGTTRPLNIGGPGVGDTINFSSFAGNIDMVRITRGADRPMSVGPVNKYPRNYFAPVASSDAHYANVVMLLHMDGEEGSTTIVDDSSYNRAMTVVDPVNQNLQLTAAAVKFGTTSYNTPYTNGNAGYLYAANAAELEFRTEDYTVECWVYPTVFETHSSRYIISKGSANFQYEFILRILRTNGHLYFTHYYVNQYGYGRSVTTAGSAAWTAIHGTDTFYQACANTWTHVAATREGNNVHLFVNGILMNSLVLDPGQDMKAVGGAMYVGYNPNYNNEYTAPFGGYIDEVKLTKGVARYTADFVVPGNYYSLTDAEYASVATLLQFDGTDGSTEINDLSANGASVPWVAHAGAALSTADKKFGTASLYLGYGQYVRGPMIPDWNFIDQDFTIEVWTKPVTQATGSNVSVGLVSCDQGLNNPRGWKITERNDNLVWSARDSVGNYLSLGGYPNFRATFINTWVHIAVTRAGGLFRFFVNGLIFHTVDWGVTRILKWDNSDTTIGGLFNHAEIGGSPNVFVGNSGWQGYIDELKVTKGVARYTADYVPPTAPDSTDTNGPDVVAAASGDVLWADTTLVIDNDDVNDGVTFTDAKGAKAITPAGDVKHTTALAQVGTSSIVFNGADPVALAGWSGITPVLIDPSLAYRVIIPVMKFAAGTASARALAPAGMVKGFADATPSGLPSLLVNFDTAILTPATWYLGVAYIYPATAAGPSEVEGGVYNASTGAKLEGEYSLDWRWADDATVFDFSLGQYSSDQNIIAAPPVLQLVDGSEPSIREWLGDTAFVSGGNKLGPSNMATYIKELAVDTLFIAGNAVTLPMKFFAAENSALVTGAQTQIVASLVFPATGNADLYISMSMQTLHSIGTDGGYWYYLFIDGVEAAQLTFAGFATGDEGGSDSAIFVYTPPVAGNYLIEIQGRSEPVGDVQFNAYNRTLICIEYKR